MRFSSGIDSLSRENRFLKQLTLIVVSLLGIMCGVVLALYNKPPIVVERSSRGLEIVKATPQVLLLDEEITQAVSLMLKARFTTNSPSPEVYLNQEQLELKSIEQTDMASKNMSQGIVIREIELKREEILAQFDRVISIGEVRSALKTLVKIKFEEISPNELNPYGLILSKVEPLENIKKGEK